MQTFFVRLIGMAMWLAAMVLTIGLVRDGTMGQSYIVVGVTGLAVAAGSFGLIFARYSWHRNAWLSAVLGSLFWLVSVAFLATAELGYWVGTINAQQEQFLDAQRAREGQRIVLDKAQASYKQGEIAQPSSQIKAQIEAKKLDPIYSRSKSCRDATVAESRALCAEIFTLTANLAAATEREKLESRIWDAATKYEPSDLKAGAFGAGEWLSRKTGYTVNWWVDAITITGILLLMLLRDACLFIAFAPDHSRKPKGASKEVPASPIAEPSVPPVLDATDKPETTIKQSPPAHLVVDNTPKGPKGKLYRLEAIDTLTKRWMRDRADAVRIERGMVASDLHVDYSAWCKAHKVKPVNDKHFGRSVRRLNVTTARGAGGAAVYGLRLRAVEVARARAA